MVKVKQAEGCEGEKGNSIKKRESGEERGDVFGDRFAEDCEGEDEPDRAGDQCDRSIARRIWHPADGH